MSELTAQWTETAAALREAAMALPRQTAPKSESETADSWPGSAEFQEYLSQNELELAWDVLAEAAGQRPDTALVWFNLARAASLMGLAQHKERAVRRLIETWPASAPYRLGYVWLNPAFPPVSLFNHPAPKKVPG